jgi:hypothetical protein
MSEGAIYSHLILDVRKKMDGCNIDLDETELSLLVGRILINTLGCPERS